MNNIIKLINNEITYQEEKIKSISIKLRDLKHVYDSLIPNKNKRDIIKTNKLVDKNTFDEFIEILAFYNNVLFNKLMQANKELDKYQKKDYNTNVFSYKVTLMDKSQLITNSLSLEKESKKMMEIFMLSLKYIVDFYESLENEKEQKKDMKKKAEYALKNIKSNLPLTSRDINTITLLIEKEDVLDKEELFNELNNYIESRKITERKKETNQPKKEEQKTYIDDKKQIIVQKKVKSKNPIIDNYLTTIRAFYDNKDAIIEFLNAISYDDDIENIINEMLLNIDPVKEKTLYDTISGYMLKMNQDEFNDDKISKEEHVNVLFYDFINNTDKMIDMIDKNIPKEEYKHLLKALELIKKDGAVSNRTMIFCLNKIYKLRVNKIRVTFKRLNHNTYIILGIFRKNNQQGSEIIAKTKLRNDRLSRYEKSIIESINIPEVWNNYLDINDEIYENIKNKIKIDKISKLK